MKSSRFKVQGSKSVVGGQWSVVRIFLLLLLTAHCSLLTVSAHEGDNNGKTPTVASQPTGKGAVTIARAERNLQIDAGQFNVRLERVPSDPRTGETAQFAVRVAEKVEGGFGAGAPIAIEDATVTANITTSEGANVAENLPTKFEKGFYRFSYAFSNAENFKIVFNVNTSDKRNFSVDFPVSVIKSPINWMFWLGMMILSLLTLGTIATVFFKTGRGENSEGRARLLTPIVATALLIFALGTFALAYFAPPRQARNLAEIPPIGTNAENAPETKTANALQTALTIPKESQILFGIKTEPVALRQITSGLKTAGVVRVRPDARAVVVPPVAGRIVFVPD